ncbi:FAD binding domain-containing protein [Alicyclobacillus curvatus]|nr:FAD binding domain-containing protein [Alicyclobacillus curvatus]
MIAIDFDYTKASSLQDAVWRHTKAMEGGISPLYYAGGTEIITFARLGLVRPDLVIDIKEIAETGVVEVTEPGTSLVTGAGVTLSAITDHPLLSREFPLLQRTVAEIADRTARNKITLGGNICGQIFYREAVLPFLVCDSLIRLVGPKGKRELPIMQVFRETLQLSPGELLVQLVTDETWRRAPFLHVKRRKMGDVGYPVVTATAVRRGGQIRAAFSGVTAFPFRSLSMERALSQEGASTEERVENAVQFLPEREVLDDFEASRGYRRFVFREVLTHILREIGR